METSMLLFTQAGFIVLTLLCYGVVLVELKKALPNTSFTIERKQRIWNIALGSIVFWLVVTSVLSLSGFIQDFSTVPPKLFIVLIIPLPAILWVTFSAVGKEVLRVIPPQKIIRLQTFRVIVELLIWLSFIQNLLPVQMTFEGRNFDVLSGLTAPVIAYFCFTRQSLSRSVAIVWNVLCMGLLLNILTVAILSMPLPFRVFMNEPANTIVTHFPFVWLPGFLVPLAYGLHFLSLRQLLSTKPAISTAH